MSGRSARRCSAERAGHKEQLQPTGHATSRNGQAAMKPAQWADIAPSVPTTRRLKAAAVELGGAGRGVWPGGSAVGR